MRILILSFVLAASPLHAETIEARSEVSEVTLFPWGASLVRTVDFSAPAGSHELVIPGLPENINHESMRVGAPDGVQVGTIRWSDDRLPVTVDQSRPEVVAAKAEVKRLEAALRQRDADITAIRLRSDAAKAQVEVLRGLGQGKVGGELGSATLDDLRALTRMVGEEVLAAAQSGHAAEQEAAAADLLRQGDVEALDKARQALTALTEETEEDSVLTLTIRTENDGPTRLEISVYSGDAQWVPSYHMLLTRSGNPKLSIERSAIITQESGEDWQSVDLILSTARPAGQSEPSSLWPQFVAIESEASRAARLEAERCDECGGYAEPVVEADIIGYRGASMELLGTTVIYRYPEPVDLRSGVDSLSLRLDTLSVEPKLSAVAVPARDATAYISAEITNTTGEIILPGDALLYLDGALVGESELPLIANGARQTLGYGPIDGIRLSRIVPKRSEGDRGILSSSNQRDEVAKIRIENLTDEKWPLRVIDSVPYSEQDDLVVSYKAIPTESSFGADGARGVLTWEFDLPAGETKDIRLEHSLSWPSGMVLK